MHDLMKVLVADRQQGKTQAMIEWLLAGHKLDKYPGWSRVIICPTRIRIALLDKRVRAVALQHPAIASDKRVFTDVCKTIWSVDDAVWGLRGMHHAVEVGIDDAETFLAQVLLGKQPAFITMTGELYDRTPQADRGDVQATDGEPKDARH